VLSLVANPGLFPGLPAVHRKWGACFRATVTLRRTGGVTVTLPAMTTWEAEGRR